MSGPTRVSRRGLGDTHGWACRYCWCPLALDDSQTEHVVPVSSRLPSRLIEHPRNYVLSCSSCNLSKGGRDPVEWFESLRSDGRLGPVPGLLTLLLEMTEDLGLPLWNPRSGNPPPLLDAARWVRRLGAESGQVDERWDALVRREWSDDDRMLLLGEISEDYNAELAELEDCRTWWGL